MRLLLSAAHSEVDMPRTKADTSSMGVSPLPRRGGVHFDQRDAGRALRVSAHPETGSVTISIWRGDYCVATHQLAAADVPDLIQLLASSLVPAPATTAPTATAS